MTEREFDFGGSGKSTIAYYLALAAMKPQLLLSNISKHITLTPGESDFFVSLLKQKSISAGDFLLNAGDICKYEAFVTKGCLKSYYEDENGFEHIIDFLIEEWWADDLFSFLTQTPAKSSIRAIEDTTLLLISKADLESLYISIPKFERFFRLLFQNAYITQRAQINQMQSVTAEERYRDFLKRKPYSEKRFPQKDIASYLGVTPQFLSTLKKKVKRVNVD